MKNAAIVLLSVLLAALGPPGAGPAGGQAWAASEWIDFSLSTPGGDRVTLRELVGKKPVLLTFWATWCPQCNAAVPQLAQIETGPLRERVKLLAIDYRESREKVGAFVSAKRIPYTVLLDSDGRVARRYGVVGVPTYILIDRQGRIAWRDNELPGDLAKYLR